MSNAVILKQALQQSVKLDFDCSNMDEHIFSQGFQRRMNRICKQYREFEVDTPHRRLSVRKVIIHAVAVAIIAGTMVIGAFGERDSFQHFKYMSNYWGSMYIATEIGDSEYVIKKIYSLNTAPEGYEIGGVSDSDKDCYEITYIRDNDFIIYSQYVKSSWSLPLFENANIMKKTVGGVEVLQVEQNGVRSFVWDNGEYVFEINESLDDSSMENIDENYLENIIISTNK